MRMLVDSWAMVRIIRFGLHRDKLRVAMVKVLCRSMDLFLVCTFWTGR